ncbi:15265_t:CDS:2, partial [Racocetra fulgida]
SDLQEVKNQLNERDQKINQQSNLIQSMVPKDKFDFINKSYNEIKSELEATKAELEAKRSLFADVSSIEDLRAQLSNAKAEAKANDWEKKRYESTISELTSKIERLTAKARELSESLSKKQNASPTINVIPTETKSTNDSNGLISERSIEPSPSKLATILETPPSKRNSAIEPSDINGVPTMPQANTLEQKNLVPEITEPNKNGVIPRPKKDDGNG